MNFSQSAQLGLLAAGLAFCSGAMAQGAADKASRSAAATSSGKSGDAKGQTGRLSSQDRNFVMKAAQAGHAEVETGQLAAAQAGDAGIRQFGEKMVQDHGKANEELASLSRTKGLEPPTTPDQAHQRLAKRLQGLKGAEFDKVYVREVGRKDHDQAIKLFRAQAKSGQDPELKAFAEKTLPVLQDHRRMAGELSADKGGSGGKQ